MYDQITVLDQQTNCKINNVTELYGTYLGGGAVSAGCSRLPLHAGEELCRTLYMPPLLFLAGGSEAHPLEHSWEHPTFGTKYNNQVKKN